MTLQHRGLDFADTVLVFAVLVFAGEHFTRPDQRRDYDEERFVTTGFAAGRFVIVVWKPRDESRRIISMRYGHAKEEANYREALGRFG